MDGRWEVTFFERSGSVRKSGRQSSPGAWTCCSGVRVKVAIHRARIRKLESVLINVMNVVGSSRLPGWMDGVVVVRSWIEVSIGKSKRLVVGIR